MKDKNEFRHLKQEDLLDTVEKSPWYIDFYEFVLSEIDSMLDMLRVR